MLISDDHALSQPRRPEVNDRIGRFVVQSRRKGRETGCSVASVSAMVAR